jgi:hypothetical protein
MKPINPVNLSVTPSSENFRFYKFLRHGLNSSGSSFGPVVGLVNAVMNIEAPSNVVYNTVFKFLLEDWIHQFQDKVT